MIYRLSFTSQCLFKTLLYLLTIKNNYRWAYNKMYERLNEFIIVESMFLSLKLNSLFYYYLDIFIDGEGDWYTLKYTY